MLEADFAAAPKWSLKLHMNVLTQRHSLVDMPSIERLDRTL